MTISRQDAPKQEVHQETNAVQSQQQIRKETTAIQSQQDIFNINQNIVRQQQGGNYNGMLQQPPTVLAPSGSVEDNVELFIELAKRKQNDVMLFTVKALYDFANFNHYLQGKNVTVRRKDVVFAGSPYLYNLAISLPSGIEVSARGDASVSNVMMQMLDQQATEYDIMAFAEAIDMLVGEMRVSQLPATPTEQTPDQD